MAISKMHNILLKLSAMLCKKKSKCVATWLWNNDLFDVFYSVNSGIGHDDRDYTVTKILL